MSLCFITVILCVVLQVLVLYKCNLLCILRLVVYDMLVNVNGIYIMHMYVNKRVELAHRGIAL